ncbi:MAG: hypothetical protein HY862_08450 [Chloroflexi bacterium]|nr:hypothetical protein [Chloroflexota bacterium]
MKRTGFLCLLLVVVISVANGPSLAQDPEEPSRVFGVVDGYWRPDDAEELGVSWERITFDWSHLQPQGPGNFEPSEVREEWITQAISSGREVVGVIVGTPLWASTNGQTNGIPSGLYEPSDSPSNLWAVFLRELMTQRTTANIRRWIIWDTPDIRSGDPGQPATLDGSAQDYYRLVKIAYQTIKAVNSKASIYLGGLVWWNDVAAGRELFLQQYLKIVVGDPSGAENNDYFDGVTLNTVIPPAPLPGITITSDSAGDITNSVRTILDQAGFQDKSIWITELNATPTADPAGGLPDAPLQISLEQQANFMIQGTAMALGAGASRIAIYKLFDSNFTASITPPYGLLRPDNSRRPAFDTYAFAIELFNTTISATASRSQNGRLVILQQEGRTLYIVWTARTQAVNFWVEAKFQDEPTVLDAFGNAQPTPRVGVGPNGVNVHVIETPPAIPDANGNVIMGGSPRILILEGEPRHVWAAVGTNALQLH